MQKNGPLLELVIPTLNEAHVLEASVHTIRKYLHEEFPYPARILVADNGSTDGTGKIASDLAAKYDDVGVYKLNQKGRGRALRQAWLASDADLVAYTDVDVSTEIEALARICRAIAEDGFHLGTGSRLLPESQVTRGGKREFISRTYNLLIKIILRTKFSDAQCGFKVLSREVVQKVVPQVVDNGWFFDTELLALAEKQGFKIKDEPVRWIDDSDSRVKIFKTAWDDVMGLLRVRRFLWSRRFKKARVNPQSQNVAPGAEPYSA